MWPAVNQVSPMKFFKAILWLVLDLEFVKHNTIKSLRNEDIKFSGRAQAWNDNIWISICLLPQRLKNQNLIE